MSFWQYKSCYVHASLPIDCWYGGVDCSIYWSLAIICSSPRGRYHPSTKGDLQTCKGTFHWLPQWLEHVTSILCVGPGMPDTLQYPGLFSSTNHPTQNVNSTLLPNPDGAGWLREKPFLLSAACLSDREGRRKQKNHQSPGRGRISSWHSSSSDNWSWTNHNTSDSVFSSQNEDKTSDSQCEY